MLVLDLFGAKMTFLGLFWLQNGVFYSVFESFWFCSTQGVISQRK